LPTAVDFIEHFLCIFLSFLSVTFIFLIPI
jgi:hypothetical protein